MDTFFYRPIVTWSIDAKFGKLNFDDERQWTNISTIDDDDDGEWFLLPKCVCLTPVTDVRRWTYPNHHQVDATWF